MPRTKLGWWCLLVLIGLYLLVTCRGAPHRNFCVEYPLRAQNQSVLGKCTSYNTMDYDEHREPKWIISTICQDTCTCCAIKPSRLHEKCHQRNDEVAMSIKEDEGNRFACQQVTTTIAVTYTNSSVRQHTFKSDCLCARYPDHEPRYCNSKVDT